MAWFRLDDRVAFHKKIVDAGNEAVGAWARAGAWSSGEGTDGFISSASALTIAPLKVWKRLEAAKAGQEHGLVEAVEGGWRIHDFLKCNPPAESVAAKRTARSEAGRLGGKRSGQARRSANGEATPKQMLQQTPQANAQAPANPDPDPGSSIPPNPPPEPPSAAGVRVPESIANFEGSYWKDAYIRAVTETTGKPFAFPDRQRNGLKSAVQTFCDTPRDAAGWVDRTVRVFVRAVRLKPQVWSGFGPDGFLRWLNCERPVERPVPTGADRDAAARPMGGAGPRAELDLDHATRSLSSPDDPESAPEPPPGGRR